jgi:hypothetical protein
VWPKEEKTNKGLVAAFNTTQVTCEEGNCSSHDTVKRRMKTDELKVTIIHITKVTPK